MNVRYRVELNEAERSELKALVSGGKAAVRKVKRAQILLAADKVKSRSVCNRLGWLLDVSCCFCFG